MNEPMRNNGSATSESIYSVFIKPVVEYISAVLLFLLLLLPVTVLTVLVRLSTGAPAFVRTKCSGKNGRIFTRHDLRTAAPGSGPEDKKRGLGAWLERTGLYRITNLINCLKLEMSLTGPRPLDAAYYYRYGKNGFRRLSVRPGLVSPSPADADGWDAYFENDAEYIENESFFSDVNLFWSGVGRALKGKAAGNDPDLAFGKYTGEKSRYIKAKKSGWGRQIILIFTLDDVDTVKTYSPCCDLAREYVKHGHSVVMISPSYGSSGLTHFIGDIDAGCRILKVRASRPYPDGHTGGNINVLNFERTVRSAVVRMLKGSCFDTVISTAPPQYFVKTCEFIVNRDHAQCVLFPGDRRPGILSDIGGYKKDSLIYNICRGREERMYWLADRILCQSEDILRHLLSENAWLDASRAEVCPLGIDIHPARLRPEDKMLVREHFDLPRHRMIFTLAGDLDSMHGCDRIRDCLFAFNGDRSVYFVVAGNGEGYPAMLEFLQKFGSANVMLLNNLSRHDTDQLLGGSDAALLFANDRISSPTFPRDIYYYMQAGLPVLAVTDEHCSVNGVIRDGGFGWNITGGGTEQFVEKVKEILPLNLADYARNSYKTLKKYYSVSDTYKKICPAGADEPVAEADQM